MAGRATEQVFPQPSPSAALCPVVVRPCMHSDSGLGEWPVPCDGTGRVVCEFLRCFGSCRDDLGLDAVAQWQCKERLAWAGVLGLNL
jgi:hypothetical protein